MELHKLALLSIYIVANVYAAWVFIDAEATTNEFSGLVVASSEVLVTCAVAVFFLCGTMLIAQPILTRLVSSYVRPRSPLRSGGVGYVVSGILAGQLIYAAMTGAQVAGQLIYLDSAWSWYFLIINGDYIFLAYYCFYRESKWCYVNIALYLALGLVRGWGGMFIILGFLEIGRQFRLGKHRNIALLAAAIVLIAPVVHFVRGYVRAMGADMQGQEVLSLFSADTLSSSTSFEGPFAALTTMADAILIRLQHLEVDLVVSSFQESIGLAYDNGLVRPFWAEGSIGKLVLRLLDIPVPIDIHLFLPGYFHGIREYANVGYNVHTGFGSWMAILGTSFPLILIYSFFLMGLAALLIRLNGGTEDADNVTWLLALLFICSGWFAPYEAFLQALVVVIAIEALLKSVGVRQSPRRSMAT